MTDARLHHSHLPEVRQDGDASRRQSRLVHRPKTPLAGDDRFLNIFLAVGVAATLALYGYVIYLFVKAIEDMPQ